MAELPWRDTRGPRYDPMFVGQVVDNQDPLRIGRVRVYVPNLLDPQSSWAFPIGVMRGVKNGVWWVPEVGSNVVVWLCQGKKDHPYYAAGPWGAPGGESDAPEQAPEGSTDHVVIRWRDFHITFNGKDGEEKLTIEDLTSETKIEIDRTTGDYTRDVEGSEVVNVAENRDVVVESGDEVHSVLQGKRDTTINGDDTRQVLSGNSVDTVTTGNRTETTTAGARTITAGGVETKQIGGASTETIGGAKAITSGGAITITATGAITLVANGIALQSSGAGVNQSAGLQTNTLQGGELNQITGTLTWNVTGLVSLLAAAIIIGSGTPLPLLTNSLLNWMINHVHPTPGLAPTPPSPSELANAQTVNLTAS